MLGSIRKWVKPWTRRFAARFSFLPLTATQFTFLSIPAAGAAAYFLAKEIYLPGTILAIISFLIDVFDGSYAEVKGQKTNFGNYWDAIKDRVTEVIIYLGLAFNFPLLAFIALSTSLLVSYAKARVGLIVVTDNHDWPGLGGMADRLTLLSVGLIIATIWSSETRAVIQFTLVLVALMTSLGFIQRFVYATKIIRKAEADGTILPYLKSKK